ncbi:hypothetical protein PPYR_05032 [Photinus pyralis]|uniref:Zasp-like motif domain-containing protein n=1 Tax=Photinus pyralis TaxID=7054 RepID=A0A1Y1L888_PHOPY|nr:DNA-directed RNA polymerase II subunit RPB1 isoform X1 [Photinus pyralis]KAB0802846.1 hypothetical protein PPYR_05032 [Photinus pyralis]
MAGQYGKLVNKQFNSPINLYSENNIREVLDREAQMLSNGAVGINFHNPGVNKPASLQNSAVLRFLEEEESRNRGGSPNLKRVAWPPPPDRDGHFEEVSAQDLGRPQITSPGLQNNQVQTANYHPPSPNQQGTQFNYQQRPELANQYRPVSFNKPIHVAPLSPSHAPSSPKLHLSPSHYSPVQPTKTWAPVQSPVSSKPQPIFRSASPQYETQAYYQPPAQEYHSYPDHSLQSPQYQYSPNRQFEATTVQPQQQHHYQQPATLPRYHQTIPKVEPPPSTITLRPQAPVSQIPAPVYTSQPATATLQGGKNLRGDLKWPPPETKAQMEEENRKRIELARGPVCRPRKVARDYRDFFAQHALNSTYPRYKIPPGTQFYVRE